MIDYQWKHLKQVIVNVYYLRIDQNNWRDPLIITAPVHR